VISLIRPRAMFFQGGRLKLAKTSYFKKLKWTAMQLTDAIDQTLIRQWHTNQMDIQAVEAELLSKGFDAEAISAYLNAYKKFKVAKKQFVGFFCMSLGAFLGFVSCILSLTNPIPELYNLILFGLTSVAISIIVVGMYFLFE
jgi:hypothetical protein